MSRPLALTDISLHDKIKLNKEHKTINIKNKLHADAYAHTHTHIQKYIHTYMHTNIHTHIKPGSLFFPYQTLLMIISTTVKMFATSNYLS